MKNTFTGEKSNYILQDKLDSRLYYKGLDEVSGRPAFTADECRSPVFNESEANILEVNHNLKRININESDHFEQLEKNLIRQIQLEMERQLNQDNIQTSIK